ncbi:hypothetical protein CALCODRAFT_503714, partial [Calocera cornea HHB12733]
RTYNPKITRKEPGDKSSYLQSGKKRQKERKVVQGRRELPLDFTLSVAVLLMQAPIDRAWTDLKTKMETAHNAHYWLQAVQLMQEAIRIHSKQNDITLECYEDAVEVYEDVQAGARDCLALLSNEMAHLRSQGDLQLWEKPSLAQDEASRLAAYFQSQYDRDKAMTSESWQNFRNQCKALGQRFSICFAGEALQQEKLRRCLNVDVYDWTQVAYMRNDLHSAAGRQEPGYGYGQALFCAKLCVLQRASTYTRPYTIMDSAWHGMMRSLPWPGCICKGVFLCTLMSQFIDNVCMIETCVRPSNVLMKSCVLLCSSSAQSKRFPLEPACFRNTSPSSRTEDRHALVDVATSLSLLLDNGIWLGAPV